ncbi:BIG/ATPase V1 complex, subunit S1, partial [Talaromyces proteolyticus]
MNPRQLLLLAFGAALVEGLKDTSPFVFLSTSDFPSSSSSLKPATSVLDDVWENLKTCPSDYYIIASQPGVHAADYRGHRATPRLREKVLGKDKAIRSNVTVSEVTGILDPLSIGNGLRDECAAQVTEIDGSTGHYPAKFGDGPRVVYVSFPALPLHEGRAQQLSHNDALLADIIDQISSPKYTLIYSTSPREYEEEGKASSVTYDSNDIKDQYPFHQDLKRDFRESNRQDEQGDNRSLFDKYQFLSPGIFMGFIALFFIVTILYVGVSALLSLEVSYAAF